MLAESVFGRAAAPLLALIAFVAQPLVAAPAQAATWQKITAPATHNVRVNGANRTIAPRCIAPSQNGDPSYSFYFKQGASDKLVVFFNGGGACFNAATCIAGGDPSVSLYTATADDPLNDPHPWSGLLDTGRSDNPFKDWSMLFLPYCTADVHIGSKDTQYTFVHPQFGPISQTIAHHGFDNFLYARDWIGKRTHGVRQVLVAGVSAGAYGAAINYPYLRESFPWARTALIGDGGNGVITGEFMSLALGESWGGAANLPPLFQPLRTFASPHFLPTAYGLLALRYPLDRFSQYTSAWDTSQTLFYNVMLHPDAPQDWMGTVSQAFLPWTATMQTYVHANALAPNYRFYVAPGCRHTILGFDRFYTMNVGGVPFADWISAQTSTRLLPPQSWKNLNSCALPGGCPFPDVTELTACFMELG